MPHSANNQSAEAIWKQTLDILRGQMTKSAFEQYLSASQMTIEEGRCIIHLRHQRAREWVENRFQPLIERTLSGVFGQSMPLQFAVQQTSSKGHSTSAASRPPQVEQVFSNLDYYNLWFGEGTSGFLMRPLYVEKFWQAYLGRAYSLWSFIQSDNRQNKSPWTRPKQYRYKYLARSLRCGFATIKGGLRPCDAYERSKERDEAFTLCCKRYEPVDWKYHTAAGEHQCMHWNSGLLEKLYDEGLLAVELKETPGRPNSHLLRLQVWRLLPLLTPWQAAQLSDAHQMEHERWLEQIGRQADFEMEAWEGLAVQSLIAKLPGYAAGRVLFDDYHPNPLSSGKREENDEQE